MKSQCRVQSCPRARSKPRPQGSRSPHQEAVSVPCARAPSSSAASTGGGRNVRSCSRAHTPGGSAVWCVKVGFPAAPPGYEFQDCFGGKVTKAGAGRLMCRRGRRLENTVKAVEGPPGHQQRVKAERQGGAVVQVLGPCYLGSHPGFSTRDCEPFRGIHCTGSSSKGEMSSCT